MSELWREISGLLEFCSVFYSILAGRCVLYSFIMIFFIQILRKTILKNRSLAKAISWCLLIPAPFVGRLRLWYENRIFVKLFFWWQNLCGDYRFIGVIYLVGVFLTGTWFLFRRFRLYAEIRMLRRITGEEFERFCGKSNFSDCGNLGSMDLYVSDDPVTPFSAGLIKHRIVIPEVFLKEEKLLEITLTHELIHIKLGHLWILFLADLYRVLLWPDILLHPSYNELKQDMEEVCDAVTMEQAGTDGVCYGENLLEGLRLLFLERNREKDNVVISVDDSAMSLFPHGSRGLASRFSRMPLLRPLRKEYIFIISFIICILVTVTVLILCRYSYSRSNPLEISGVYSIRHGDTVILDDDWSVVTYYDDHEVVIDGAEFAARFPDYDQETDTIFVFCGGFYKVPGVGGGGGWAELTASDVHPGEIRLENHAEESFAVHLMKLL